MRHHYDLPPEFFALFLGEELTYSCALFTRGATTLEEAQEQKLDMVCRKLELAAGQRVLDVGCGWGSFAIHAAERHDVRVLGITLSEPQAAVAQRRVRERGLEDRVEIRVADYRELHDDPFDAVASIGMVEHVGSSQIDVYAQQLARALRPGGRLLNHGIARMRMGDPEAGPVLGALRVPRRRPAPPLAHPAGGRARRARDRPRGGPARQLRGHARATGRSGSTSTWTRRSGWPAPERVRVWRLYLRAARRGFESGFISVYQVRATRPGARSRGARAEAAARAGARGRRRRTPKPRSARCCQPHARHRLALRSRHGVAR